MKNRVIAALTFLSLNAFAQNGVVDLPEKRGNWLGVTSQQTLDWVIAPLRISHAALDVTSSSVEDWIVDELVLESLYEDTVLFVDGEPAGPLVKSEVKSLRKQDKERYAESSDQEVAEDLLIRIEKQMNALEQAKAAQKAELRKSAN